MSRWPLVALSEIFGIARGGSPRPIDDFITDDPAGINWIMIGDASEGSKYISSTKKRIRPEGAQRSRTVKSGDFLLTNSMSFGKPYIMRTSGCIHDGWLVLSPRQDDVDADFFYHLLGSSAVYSEFERLAAGATVKNLNIDLVRGVKVPLPPLPEQRRIAEILDKADALRTKRRAAIARLDSLTQSIFLEMFGEPIASAERWGKVSLGDTLMEPLRNGLSPSSGGVYNGKVLTLSAITGTSFDRQAVKVAPFRGPSPINQTVCASDFLICRGNGNVKLVGKARFPRADMPDVTFPDTMIAARVSPTRFVREFLEQIWNMDGVRRQLESVARTTNGTFKINQEMVSRIELVAPPVEQQATFSRRTKEIEELRVGHFKSLKSLDSLFASLQHRAFRGEL